jgi:large subunit ribosomal protein L33
MSRLGPASPRFLAGKIKPYANPARLLNCEADKNKAPIGPLPGPIFFLGESKSMAKSKKKLEVVHLVCEETGDYNYTLRRKSGGEKLKVKKYSPRLRKHTVHVEKKK